MSSGGSGGTSTSVFVQYQHGFRSKGVMLVLGLCPCAICGVVPHIIDPGFTPWHGRNSSTERVNFLGQTLITRLARFRFSSMESEEFGASAGPKIS